MNRNLILAPALAAALAVAGCANMTASQ